MLQQGRDPHRSLLQNVVALKNRFTRIFSAIFAFTVTPRLLGMASKSTLRYKQVILVVACLLIPRKRTF